MELNSLDQNCIGPSLYATELDPDENKVLIGIVAIDKYGNPHPGHNRKIGVKTYCTKRLAMAAVARKVSRSPWTFVPAYIEVQQQ